MTDKRLGLSASKSELAPTPADQRLNDKRRQAGIAHGVAASIAGRAAPVKGVAVDQVFAVQLRDQSPKQVQKSEQANLEPCVAGLRLSPDGGLLLVAMKSEMERTNGRPVDMVADRAGEVLGIGRARAFRAKEELLERGLIRPVVNSLGGPSGYRVVMPYRA
mgnify:CR=1 FL=1